MKTENEDKPASVQSMNTLVGFLTVVVGGTAWAAGVAVAGALYGFWVLLAAIVLPPVAWVLWAAQLMGLTQ
jgi:hypothetical protein